MKILLLLGLLIPTGVYAADVKLSRLPLATAIETEGSDSFAFVASTSLVTKRLTLWDIVNLPPMILTYAPLVSPALSGTPLAPTAIAGTSNGQIATTQFVSGAIIDSTTMPTSRIKGRITALSGVAENLTGAQVSTLLPEFVGDSGTGGSKGLVPAPLSGDALGNKFLKASGVWEQVISGANPTLSNLTNPTAINESLYPSGDNNGKMLGNFDKRWTQLWSQYLATNYMDFYNSDVSEYFGSVGADQNGADLYMESYLAPGVQNPLGLWLQSIKTLRISTYGYIGTSAPIQIYSAPVSSGSNNSGSITLQTGTSSGGIRGKIILDGSTIDVSSKRIENVLTPTAATDAVNKAYADASGFASGKQSFLITGPMISAQYVDLAQVIKVSSLDFMRDGLIYNEGTDYTVSLTGGVAGKTRVTFIGSLASTGSTPLNSGNRVYVKYSY